MNKDLDQFYTNPKVAKLCTDTLFNSLNLRNISNYTFVEPSAGTGSFVKELKNQTSRILSFDIDPKLKDTIKLDFINSNVKPYLTGEKFITIGNPPFGRRAKLAIDFINKAFDFSETVAFIVPVQFRKFSAQSKIIKDSFLINDTLLREDAFLFDGKPYKVRCCFQIWTKLKKYENLNMRIKEAPPTNHKDFELFQYNNTIEARKFFNKEKYKWKFAVPRQGYQDYSRREEDPKKLEIQKQWVFVKPNTTIAYKKLYNIDYEKLSKNNTTVPGFGKADIIQEYERL